MPCGGAMTLADTREAARDPLRAVRATRLNAKHDADMRLPELLTILADCPKARAFSIYDRCQVRYERYYGRA
jgi:hypothetical protein